MSLLELTPARISAVLTAFYHIPPWEQNNLTDDQITSLMRELDYVRFLLHEAEVVRQFGEAASTVKEEERAARLREMVAPPVDDGLKELRQQAFTAFIGQRYRLDHDAPPARVVQVLPGISREAAQGVVAWWEAGHCPDDLWSALLPHYQRLIATAES